MSNPTTIATTANPTTIATKANPTTIAETNVVNDKNTFTYSDYNTEMLAKEADKLQNLNTINNNKESLYSNSKNFYNLSLNEVVNNTVLTVVAIFVDLLQLQKKYSKQPINYQDIFDIFTKGDRLIYFGVFLIFLSLLFMVLFISS
jgi:ABC-type transporter Mla subunit MlaD